MAADFSASPTPVAFPSSGAARERAGKSLLRERFDAAKDTALEDDMGKGESWAKKVGYGDSGVKLDDIPKLVAALGLKLVDVHRICITPDELAEYQACRTLARRHLAPPAPYLEQDFDR